MISAGLEPATTAIKRLQTYVLDRMTADHREKRVSTYETWLFTGLWYWFWILALGLFMWSRQESGDYTLVRRY